MNTVMNKISAVALGSVFAISALAAPTANAGALEDQIAALLAQIAALQAQISGTSGTTTTTTSTPTYVYSRLLKVGKKGNDVKELQTCLNRLGNNTGVADGIFGPNTKAGVMSFQAQKGLVVDGIIGPQTGPQFEAACMIGGTTTTGGDNGSTGVVGDKLVVSGLASDDMLVGPSQKVVFSKLTLEAGDEDVMVKNIFVSKTGSADRNVIEKVQLLDSAMLELDSDNIDSDDEAKLKADLEVRAGKTKVLYIAAVMHDNTTGGTYITAGDGLEVSLKVTNITTDGADVEGTPIMGAVHTVKDNVTVDSFDAEITKDENSPKIGETVKLATVNVDNSTNDNQMIKSLKLKRQGTASDDALDNVEIEVDGKTYSADQDDDEYTFDFGDGIEVKDGDDVDLELMADIEDDAGSTVAFDIMDITVLDEDGQILSEADAADGYTSGSGTGEWKYTSTATIGTSSFVLSKTSDVSDSNVAAGSTEVELASFKVDVDGEWVEGDVNIQITLDTTNVTGGFPSNASDVDLENIAIYEKGGSRVSDKEDLSWTIGGQKTVTFDTVKFDDGETEYVIKADINKDAPNKTDYTIDDIQVVNAETKSGDNVGPFPATAKALNLTHTVEGSVIDVTANAPSPANITADNTVGDNGSEQVVAEIELDATDSGDDINVTEVKFDITVTDNTGLPAVTSADVTNCTLEGSNDTEDAGVGMTFSLDEVVSKDTTKTLLVKCDIGANALATDTVDLSNVTFDAEGVSTGTNFNNATGSGSFSVTVVTPALTVKKHADDPDAKAVMDNETKVVAGVLELEAVDGDVKVATLNIEASDYTALKNGKVYVYVDGVNKGDVTLTANATPLNTSNLNFTIKEDEKAKVELKIDTPSGYTGTTALTVNNVTLSDSTVINTGSGIGSYNLITVVTAMPVVTLVNSNTITMQTSLETDQELMVFKIKADGGDVTVTDVNANTTGTITFSNNNVKVYSDSSLSNLVQEDLNITGGFDGSVPITNVTISDGDTYYFVLEADLSASSGQSATLVIPDALGGIVFNPALNSSLLMEDEFKTTINTNL